MSIERGSALVHQWSPKFGLGDFRLHIGIYTGPEAWAESFYDIEEMWGIIRLPEDDALPEPQLELLVLHELAHGLVLLAQSGTNPTVEQCCNRIARLARGDVAMPNEYTNAPAAEEFNHSNVIIDKHAWLNIVADALPEKERRVIQLHYGEDRSLREIAVEMGVSHVTIMRWRNAALTRLGRYFTALESVEWNQARRIIALQEPEGGAEHEVIYTLHHRCPQANALIHTEVGDPDMDLLVFPVGNYGYGMPQGVPFSVQALAPCRACGRDIGCYFTWQAGHAAHPGHLWTPDEA